MSNSRQGRIKYHPWSCPTHHLTYLLTHLRGVAVHRTVLTGLLRLAKLTAVQTSKSILLQAKHLLRELFLPQLFSRVEPYHLPHHTFFTLYLTSLLSHHLKHIISRNRQQRNRITRSIRCSRELNSIITAHADRIFVQHRVLRLGCHIIRVGNPYPCQQTRSVVYLIPPQCRCVMQRAEVW